MAEERIDPNTADLDSLRKLPGIGAELAQRIAIRRPYRTAEDLLTVPGLGRRTLERIRPQLDFDELAESVGEAAAGAETDQGAAPALFESPPMRREETVAPPPASDGDSGADEPLEAIRRLARRTPSLWAALGLAVASILCSVSLSLVVLLGINGTLDYGRHAAVRRVDSGLSQVQSDLREANSEVNAVRQRLEVIEGLSGRMTELEARMDQVQLRLETVDMQLVEIRQQLEAMQLQADRIGRIEAFFLGLQELLGQWFPVPEG